MAASVPVPIARPRSAWASAAASLTPSPTMATDLPSAWRRLTTATLSSGSTSATTCSASMPTSAATERATAALSPVSSTGVRPRARSRRIASALVGLTASATTSTARASPSQATATAVCPASSAAALASARVAGSSMAHSVRSEVRPTRTAWPSTTPWTPRPGTFAKSSGVGSPPVRSSAAAATARAMGCSEECSRAPARRSASVSDTPSARWTAVRVIAPVVTVPVLSRTTVSTRRVVSSTSGPLIRMPNWAPRPVPTMSAVGVASPRAHGQAMISTATAAGNAATAPAPVASQ